MKKKVIALVVDTELTNEELERGKVVLTVDRVPGDGRDDVVVEARNVRVLDSD